MQLCLQLPPHAYTSSVSEGRSHLYSGTSGQHDSQQLPSLTPYARLFLTQVNTDSDANNCGTCAYVCDFTANTCQAGTCKCGPNPGCVGRQADYGTIGTPYCDPSGSCAGNALGLPPYPPFENPVYPGCQWTDESSFADPGYSIRYGPVQYLTQYIVPWPDAAGAAQACALFCNAQPNCKGFYVNRIYPGRENNPWASQGWDIALCIVLAVDAIPPGALRCSLFYVGISDGRFYKRTT